MGEFQSEIMSIYQMSSLSNITTATSCFIKEKV